MIGPFICYATECTKNATASDFWLALGIAVPVVAIIVGLSYLFARGVNKRWPK